MLEKANFLSPRDLNALKYQSLVYLRLKKYEKATEVINEYASRLISELDSLDKYHGQQTWESNFEYLQKELNWSKDMSIKISGIGKIFSSNIAEN